MKTLPTIFSSLVLVASLAASEPRVIEEGAHYRVWARQEGNYTEMETGMNHFDLEENKWKPGFGNGKMTNARVMKELL
jgi:hypothetical protein